jgi:hypothetical protein
MPEVAIDLDSLVKLETIKKRAEVVAKVAKSFEPNDWLQKTSKNHHVVSEEKNYTAIEFDIAIHNLILSLDQYGATSKLNQTQQSNA